jgi:hypothetical protein
MTNEWDPAPDDDDEDELGPGDADYDLSEEYGYSWDPRREHWPVPPWLLAVISLLVIVALVLPAVLLVLRYG